MGKKLLFFFFLTLAYLNPTSGLAQCPTSVSISANPGTTICSGNSVTFTATPNGGTNLSYEWFIGNTSQSASGNTFTTSSLSNSDKIKVIVTSSDEVTCSKQSNILTMTVNPMLNPSVSISASKTSICPGENVTFTASPINGGSTPSYIWKIGTTIQSSTSGTFSTTELTNGQSVTAELTSSAICASPTTATSSPINITVKPGTPATPGTITGENAVCPGLSKTFTVAAVTNATSYEWTLPSGWSGTSTSNSISATSGGTGSGTISVKAKNECGTSASQTFDVTVLDGTPNTPGTITGDAQVCPGLSKTYSIAAVSGATEYEWLLPSGWNGTSTSNSIDVTTGTSGNGNITVKAKNSCGTSAAKTFAVSVKPGTPAVPTAISGTISICPGTTNTYSIAAVTNATSYEWTLPNGWTGNSTSTSINATSTSSGGTITVKAINDCGTSDVQTLDISLRAGTPAKPVNLSGSNTVCPNTSETYTITNDATATEYIWTLPNGWTGTSSTSSLTVNTGTSGSGNITVKAKNDCGTSDATTIAVSVSNPAPVMSGSISGTAIVCTGSGGLSYTIPAIANATSYAWTVPSGWTITGGSGTRAITATAGTSGNITVKAINTCGESADSGNFAVSAASGVPASPGVITSPALSLNPNVCPPATGITFSVVPVANATSYNWIMPTGWEITSGDNTNSITARANANTPFPATQSVKVEAVNICGKSGQSAFNNINISNHVDVSLGSDQTVCKTTNPISINASIGFGGKSIRITSVVSDGSGTFNGLPNSNQKVDDFNFTYTPSASDIANKTEINITLTAEKPNGACTQNVSSDVMKIIFKPDPTASISGTSTICNGNATDITFTATPNTIVTYKKDGGANQTIVVGTSGSALLNTGALTATSTYSLVSVKNATTPECSKNITGSAIITITPKPTATISYTGSPYSKCLSSGAVTLTGTGAYQNGSFTAPAGLSINKDTGVITPSSSTAGTYTVTYETLASGGCEKVSTTTQVVIVDIPTITLSYAETPFCSDNSSSPLPNLAGTGAFEGGSYSAETGLIIHATSGAINIASSAPGSYNVVYSVTPASGCTPVTQTTPIVITEKPQPKISYSAVEFCKSVSNSQAVNLTQTGTATITGGNYTSSPSGLYIDATSGAINPSLSDAGDYTIKYTLPTANGCAEVFTEAFLTINEIPSVEISYNTPSCNNAGIITVAFANGIGAFEGGTFSATPGGLNIDPASGEINTNTSSPGEYTVKYLIKGTGGCSDVEITTSITITQLPQVTMSYPLEICSSEISVLVNLTVDVGAVGDGMFGGTEGLDISEDGTINPSASTTGPHTVQYTIASEAGCDEVMQLQTL